jgi:transcriptional regulator with XRE-family HTH domain
MGGQKVRDLSVMVQFGERLRQLRKEKNLTQKELALKAGLSTSQIARIETGKLNTTISTLVIISRAIDIELVVFFERFLM